MGRWASRTALWEAEKMAERQLQQEEPAGRCSCRRSWEEEEAKLLGTADWNKSQDTAWQGTWIWQVVTLCTRPRLEPTAACIHEFTTAKLAKHWWQLRVLPRLQHLVTAEGCMAYIILLICDDSHGGAHGDVLAVVTHQDLC